MTKLGCRIIEDQNQVVEVLDKQGNTNKVFKQTLKSTGSISEAINLSSVAETEFFEDHIPSTDSDLSQVKEFLSHVESINKTLTEKQKLDLQDTLIDLEMPLNSFKYKLYDTFYGSGDFVVSEAKLTSSGLYSVLEVQEIMSNPSLQLSIKDFAERLKFESSEYADFFSSPKIKLNSFNSLGKSRFMDPLEEESDHFTALVEARTREDFDSFISNSMSEAYQNLYFSDESFSNNRFDYYKSFKVIPVLNEDLKISGNKVYIQTEFDNLYQIDTNLSDLAMYSSNGFFRVQSNLYKKLKPLPNNVEQILIDQKSLPQEAYYPVSFNSSNQLDDSLMDRTNPSLIRTVRNYIDRNSENTTKEARDFFVYKTLLSPSSIEEEQIYDFSGDYSYLTSEDFIIDLATKIEMEARQDSELYKKVLSNLYINNNKVYLKYNNDYIKSNMELLDDKSKILTDLKEYSKISNTNLKDLYDHSPILSLGRDVKEVFTPIIKDNVLILKNTFDNVVKFNKNLYFRVNFTDQVSYYEKADSTLGYNVGKIPSQSPVTSIYESRFSNDYFDSRNPTKKVLDSINRKIDECGA